MALPPTLLLLALLLAWPPSPVRAGGPRGADAKWAPLALPAAFDERTQPSACARVILDQGACGSSYAFAASRVFSDRLCRASGGTFSGSVSEQEIAACYKSGAFYNMNGKLIQAGYWPASGACNGGSVTSALVQMVQEPRVARWADPYTLAGGGSPTCQHKSGQGSFEFTAKEVQPQLPPKSVMSD